MKLSPWDWIWISSTALFALAILAKFAKTIFVKRPNIAIVSLNGVIKYDDRPQSVFKQFQKSLDEVGGDKNMRAMVLRVNSPGGTVGASQEIYESILALRQSGVKVVALMEDVAASGGLYVSMAADYIVAHPGTLTGSIGVIFQNYGYPKLLERFQIEARVIKAGKNKDLLSSTREVTEEEKVLLQEVADEVHVQFQTAVATSRNLPLEKVQEFGDGRIMNGSRALALGLVDDCGGFAVAKAAAEELAGLVDGLGIVKDVRPNAPMFERFAHILGKFNILGESNILSGLAAGTSGTGPLLLWLMPGYDL